MRVQTLYVKMLYITLFIEREKNIGQSAPECPFKKATHSTVWSLSCSITESEHHDEPSNQLSRYIILINSDSFDSTAESSALSKLYADFALLQPLFQRLFCVPASSAPVDRVFSQSGLIMSSHRAHMLNAVLECLVFSQPFIYIDGC